MVPQIHTDLMRTSSSSNNNFAVSGPGPLGRSSRSRLGELFYQVLARGSVFGFDGICSADLSHGQYGGRVRRSDVYDEGTPDPRQYLLVYRFRGHVDTITGLARVLRVVLLDVQHVTDLRRSAIRCVKVLIIHHAKMCVVT
ncbi:wd-repeat protein [Culex quinquefasciatus]|uniref:Wd-repeat protein n=1 Tax=Culex quinquefasciatus TaxID=7176 RepID=B0XJ05_CULQU|nr:wd-repeat protein [Culex quinquefasciatus]|eukprot:XP_001869627.1 wd-repeat protein [Culex quinquefasciatus]